MNTGKRKININSLAAAVFTLVFLLPSSIPASPLSLEGRAVYSLGYDDNVREASESEEGDFLHRFILEGRTRLRCSDRVRISGILWNGAEFFHHEEEENRLQSKVTFLGSFRHSILDASLTGNLDTSYYFNQEIEIEADAGGEGEMERYYYLKPGAQLRLSRQLPWPVDLGLIGTYQYFDYHPWEDLDYHLFAYSLQGDYQVTGRWHLQLSAGQDRRWYASEAIALTESEDLDRADYHRRDTIHEVSLSGSYYNRFLLKPVYSFQVGDSNSYGLDYTNHRISLIFSCPVIRSTQVHLFTVIQVKRYSSVSENISWPEYLRILIADEEDDNLNSINFRIEHRFTRHLSLQFTFNRYSNEFSESRSFARNVYLLGLRWGN